MGANAAWRVTGFVLRWEDRIFSVLEDCSFLAARLCYFYLIFYYAWVEPWLIVLLSKIMGGGGL